MAISIGSGSAFPVGDTIPCFGTGAGNGIGSGGTPELCNRIARALVLRGTPAEGALTGIGKPGTAG